MIVRHRPGRSAAVAALIAGLLMLASAPALGARPHVVMSSDRATSRAAQVAAIDHWTPERMEAAIPMPVPRVKRGTPPSGTIPDAGLKPRSVPASEPASSAQRAASVSPTGYAYPFPFTRYAITKAQYKTFPHMAIGKIFFTQNGYDYVCSGASVAGGPRQIVWTAGHCVSNGSGVWSTNMVFVPGYRNGTAPYGVFPAKVMVTTSPWHLGADLTFDFAAFNVGKSASKLTLRAQVGWLGFAWNWPRIQHWAAIGYPQASPFNGEKQQVCQASHAVDDTTVPGIGYDTMGIGCDLTGGASGGPWVLGIYSGDLINGLNSYKWSDQPLAMYGPYLDTFANQIRCTAATGAPADSC